MHGWHILSRHCKHPRNLHHWSLEFTLHKEVTGRVNIINISFQAPLTQPLSRLAGLYKTYKPRMGGHSCSAVEPVAEVVTEPNGHLCKKGEAAGRDRGVFLLFRPAV